MTEKEQAIKDQRLIEATTEGLVGLGGKLGCILKYMGQPILCSVGGGLYQCNEIPDAYDIYNEEETPTMELWEISSERGFIYDALKMGIHLEITYNGITASLSVRYKGIKVYEEVGGGLECYTPEQEWISKVNKIHAIAKNKEKISKEKDNKEMTIQAKRDKQSFLEMLKTKWGLR